MGFLIASVLFPPKKRISGSSQCRFNHMESKKYNAMESFNYSLSTIGQLYGKSCQISPQRLQDGEKKIAFS